MFSVCLFYLFSKIWCTNMTFWSYHSCLSYALSLYILAFSLAMAFLITLPQAMPFVMTFCYNVNYAFPVGTKYHVLLLLLVASCRLYIILLSSFEIFMWYAFMAGLKHDPPTCVCSFSIKWPLCVDAFPLQLVVTCIPNHESWCIYTPLRWNACLAVEQGLKYWNWDWTHYWYWVHSVWIWLGEVP